MKLLNLETVNNESAEKQLFTFGLAEEGRIVSVKGNKLVKYVEYCFSPEGEMPEDVSLEFVLDEEEYRLQKNHDKDGAVRVFLHKKENGKYQIVAGGQNVASYIRSKTECEMASLVDLHYVSNRTLRNFKGDLSLFGNIRTLLDISENADRTSRAIQEKSDGARAALKNLSATALPEEAKKQVEAATADLIAVSAELSQKTGRLAELKYKAAGSGVAAEIASELAKAEKVRENLAAQEARVEKIRRKVAQRDEMAALVPKAELQGRLAREKEELAAQKNDLDTQIDLLQKEMDGINERLAENDRASASDADKQNKIVEINAQYNAATQLKEANAESNDRLAELNEQADKKLTEKVALKNKLISIEADIDEVKAKLAKLEFTGDVGQLLESVRINAKVDELSAQIEKLQEEILEREQQISSRENALVTHVKRFRSVSELDVAIAPIKAKDIILQVLESKYGKFEAINASLEEKRRNLERAFEDYNYKLMLMDQSNAALVAELEKQEKIGIEEFKREVYLAGQKTTAGGSDAYAVTLRTDNAKTASLKQEISARDADRKAVLQKIGELQGKLEEIRRQYEINQAEMETLLQEKSNINERYKEIVAMNSNDTVVNYFKALESNNGTKYLLDIQQDMVKNETELSEIKRVNEGEKNKLYALQNRLRSLKEAQNRADDDGSLIALVSTNDRLKDELSAITEKLSADYDRHKEIERQIAETDAEYTKLQDEIDQLQRAVRFNEVQVAAYTDNIRRLIGEEEVEDALKANEIAATDNRSEREMLLEDKRNLEKEIYEKRLEKEKLQWLYDGKAAEYDAVTKEIKESKKLPADFDPESFEKDSRVLRDTLTEYDEQCRKADEKIANYRTLAQEAGGEVDEKLLAEISALESETASLAERQSRLEAEQKEKMDLYLASTNEKARMAVIAKEAQTLNDMKEAIRQNEVVALLVNDKIKNLLQPSEEVFRSITGKDYAFVVDGKTLSLQSGDDTLSYEQLDDEEKCALYMALVIGSPQKDKEPSDWLIFDENLDVGKRYLNAALKHIKGVQCVINYSGN